MFNAHPTINKFQLFQIRRRNWNQNMNCFCHLNLFHISHYLWIVTRFDFIQSKNQTSKITMCKEQGPAKEYQAANCTLHWLNCFRIVRLMFFASMNNNTLVYLWLEMAKAWGSRSEVLSNYGSVFRTNHNDDASQSKSANP